MQRPRGRVERRADLSSADFRMPPALQNLMRMPAVGLTVWVA